MLEVTVAAVVTLAVAAVTSPALAGQSGGRAEPALSSAEAAVVKRQIATLHSPADRNMANGWSNAKKVAEVICRPAAVAALKTQVPGTDRVFLGTNDPRTLKLESTARLTGSGSARSPKGWQDFSFTCEVNPQTGNVTSFVPILAAADK